MTENEKENEKIRAVIEKYRSYLEHSEADVGHTEKGRWFLYEYDERYRYFSSYFQFRKAAQLEHLIVQMMSEDLLIAAEVEAESIAMGIKKSEKERLADGIKEIEIEDAMQSCYERSIAMLVHHMEIFEKQHKENEKRWEDMHLALTGILKGLPPVEDDKD